MSYRKTYTPSYIGKITFGERRQAFRDAHAALCENDQLIIEAEVNHIYDVVKEKTEGTQFNKDMANEVIACLGMWLVKNEL